MTRYAGRHAATPASLQAGEEFVMFLEPDQLLACTQRPVQRAQLSRRANAALWALRILVIFLSVVVIYAFFSRLRS